MININLIRETTSAGSSRKMPEFSLGAKQADIILVVSISILLLVTGARWYILSSKLDDLKTTERQKKKERDDLQQYIEKVDELEAKREALRQKIEIINSLKKNQRGPVRVMDEVSRALPDLVWLTNMKLAGNDLTLNGMAMDENAVANYIANISASPFFAEPVLRDLSRSDEKSFKFVLRCKFTNVAPQIEAAGS